MFSTIILIVTSMGFVAFSGLGYLAMYDTANSTYVTWLEVYIIFACGVGVGLCIIGLYDNLVFTYQEMEDKKWEEGK